MGSGFGRFLFLLGFGEVSVIAVEGKTAVVEDGWDGIKEPDAITESLVGVARAAIMGGPERDPLLRLHKVKPAHNWL